MKLFKILSLAAFTLTFAFAMSSCGNTASTETDTTEQTPTNEEEATTTEAESTETEANKEEGPEYTSAYICPMHCEGSGSAEEGKCPVCGMDYVKNDKFEGDTQDEDATDGEEHEGHQHGENVETEHRGGNG